MEGDPSDDVTALVPALLRSLEAVGLVARHFHPPEFRSVMDSVGSPDGPLRAIRPRLDAWPPSLAEQRDGLAGATDAVLAAFDELRAAPDQPDGLRAVFRALRQAPRAQEALYPLASVLPPVNRYFLDRAFRDNAALQARLTQAPPRADTGVIHGGGEPGARGGYSMYVPEYYTPDRPWPLVMALHGGGGNGRSFLWSWLASARSCGAVLVAPTATGDTWALMGADADTPNLTAILEHVQSGWTIDPARRLLTGMSDGGTFTYVSGLEAGSPFTHLAPVSAAFHPMLAQMADPQRMQGLPILLIHGALDWMFPVDQARQARQALAAAGARVTYREIEDLSHTYPREVNAAILDWMEET